MTNNIINNKRARVYWSDKPENFTREGKSEILSYFSKKYDIPRKYINVFERPIKLNADGEVVTINCADLENVMDVNYQRQLFKEWLKREERTVDFDEIIKFDDEVNLGLDYDITGIRQRKYTLKWVEVDNLLCFGDIGRVEMDKLKGLICVNSTPENMGGKTTFSLDIPYFLLFGKTTKSEVNEDIFNTYSKKDNVIVKGLLEINGDEYIIERTLTRRQKKDGDWAVTNTVNYLKYINGKEIALNEEDAKETTKLIRETVGTEDDFMLMVLATNRNIEDLIFSTPTEKGKLINRFVGLEVIEKKEVIARQKYNAFVKTMLSNIHDPITLGTEITDLQEEIEMYKTLLLNNETNLNEIIEKLTSLDKEKTNLFNKKHPIDESLFLLNPEKINQTIINITKKGTDKKKELDKIKVEYEGYGEITFDEVKYHELNKERRLLEKELDQTMNRIEVLAEEIEALSESKLCLECGRPYDNTTKIKLKTEEKKTYTKNKVVLEGKIEKLNVEIKSLEEDEVKKQNKARLELEMEKLEVDIKSLRNDLKVENNNLKSYNLNQDKIEFNKTIESQILGVNAKIQMQSVEKGCIIKNIETIKNDINNNTESIKTKEGYLEKIRLESQKEMLYKTYVEMVGKKGISKIVMRSVLPLINYEIHRLLDDTVDFDIELKINSKNNIEIYLVRDEVTKKIRSGSGFERTVAALALRFVLGQISTLPKINFISFDEVFGAVADVNFEAIKLLFDKATDFYDTIFIITHENQIKDWADKLVVIEKKNNIASLIIN